MAKKDVFVPAHKRLGQPVNKYWREKRPKSKKRIKSKPIKPTITFYRDPAGRLTEKRVWK